MPSERILHQFLCDENDEGETFTVKTSQLKASYINCAKTVKIHFDRAAKATQLQSSDASGESFTASLTK
jgi:hypothetical protein